MSQPAQPFTFNMSYYIGEEGNAYYCQWQAKQNKQDTLGSSVLQSDRLSCFNMLYNIWLSVAISRQMTGCIYIRTINKFFLAQQPPVDQSLLIHEVSRSHTTTHHSR